MTGRLTAPYLVNTNSQSTKNFVNRGTKKTQAPPSPVTKK
jgi:hypothetical protein